MPKSKKKNTPQIKGTHVPITERSIDNLIDFLKKRKEDGLQFSIVVGVDIYEGDVYFHAASAIACNYIYKPSNSKAYYKKITTFTSQAKKHKKWWALK